MAQALITGTPDFCRCSCPDVCSSSSGSGGSGNFGGALGGVLDPPATKPGGGAWSAFDTYQDTDVTSRHWWYSVDLGWVPDSA